MTFKCVLCKKETKGWGDKNQYGCSPYPLAKKGECCEHCNNTRVIPARLKIAKMLNMKCRHEDRWLICDNNYLFIGEENIEVAVECNNLGCYQKGTAVIDINFKELKINGRIIL